MIDEHLLLSGVGLVMSCIGSIAFKLIVLVGEGETKSASLTFVHLATDLD